MDADIRIDTDQHLKDATFVSAPISTPSTSASSMSRPARESFCRQYLSDRQRGRVDLLWLCNEVLQYPDVCATVHGPVIDSLQSFNGHEEYMDQDTFEIKYSEPKCVMHEIGDKGCTPACAGRTIWHLPGPRFRMLLDPRGHLKTTVNTISHALQWIINFTDIRIALSVATGPQGADIITEIENQFRYNSRFRFLYPEYCPAGERSGDWGSKEQFTVPNRRRKWLKEPTMRVVSIGKVVAGPHYDVIKHSDLVDKENVKTPGGIKDTKDHFKYTMPLLERGPSIAGRDRTVGWVDLEGTIYDFSDLYVEELEKDEARSKAGKSCRWAVFRRDAVVDEIKDEDLWKKPFATLWPERFPYEELHAIYEDIGDYMFNCQYRLRPKSRGMGLCQPNEIKYFPARIKPSILPRLYIKVTIDLAGMEEDTDGCNISVCTVGHNRDGRKYVLEALVARPTAAELVDYLFDVDTRYRKPVFQFEAAHHYQGLSPYITMRSEMKQQFLNIVAIPRDSNTQKDNRIFYTLQPLFKRGLIWFSDDIKYMPHIVNEITKFPKFKYKDFLDTLADQMQTKGGKVDLQTAIPTRRRDPSDPRDPDFDPLHVQGKFMGFNPVTKAPMWSDEDPSREAVFGNSNDPRYAHDNMTGVL